MNNMFIMFSQAMEHETISLTHSFALIQDLNQTQPLPPKVDAIVAQSSLASASYAEASKLDPCKLPDDMVVR